MHLFTHQDCVNSAFERHVLHSRCKGINSRPQQVSIDLPYLRVGVDEKTMAIPKRTFSTARPSVTQWSDRLLRTACLSAPGWSLSFHLYRSGKSSANRKRKYSSGGVRQVASHESEEPRRSNTSGSFLGKRSRHPRQYPLIGEGGRRLASSRPAALSVSEGPIGIPVLFLCLWGAERGSSAHAPVLWTPLEQEWGQRPMKQ